MVSCSASTVLCLLAALVGSASGGRTERLCPKGWDHYCDDESNVMSMTEFEYDRQCLGNRGLCPKGWDHYCNDESKCVISMTEFENDRQCLRKGGVPGVIACFQQDTAVFTETHERMCIQDLNTGKFGFARNLQDAMKKLEKEEEEEEDDMGDFDK